MILTEPKDFKGWLDYIEQLSAKEIDLGIEKLKSIVTQLKKPKNLTIITVGGTNGKGTCANLSAQIYQQAGVKVAVYTSPHLHCFRERLLYKGQCFSEQDWCEAFVYIDQIRNGKPLTFFEMTTLAAIKMVYASDAELLILEVGLGGRLDAVNCIDADVSVITSIDIDHTSLLGTSRKAIAFEKAGIYRPFRPAIFAGVEPPESLISEAKRLKADLMLRGQDFDFKLAGDGINWEWLYKSKLLTGIKPYELSPSALAGVCQLVSVLQNTFFVPDTILLRTIESFSLPGRFERHMIHGVPFVFDVAHNPAACSRLAELITYYYPEHKKTVWCGFVLGKDVTGCFNSLASIVDEWRFFSAKSRPSFLVDQLEEKIKKIDQNCEVNRLEIEAIDHWGLIDQNISNRVIVIMGSFLVVDMVKRKMNLVF